MSKMEDKENLIDVPEVKVYRRRWYILFLFSFLAMFQCTVWNTFGPVVNTVEVVYPTWTDSTVSLLTNWGPIAFLVFLVPTLYVAEKSLRAAIVLSSGLVFIGAGVRCLFLVDPQVSDKVFLGLCHLGAILNGIPGIIVTSIPAAVSSAWFPPHERVTATSISQMLNNVGTALSFLIAELMVPENTASTDSDQLNQTCQHKSPGNSSRENEDQLRTKVQHYLLALTAPAALLFSLAIIYFPSKPPQPPSRSSTEQRLSFLSGINEMIRCPSAWMIAVIWSIPQAIWNNWCALMVVSLTKIGENGECLTEKWVNMLGIVAVLVGTGVAILVGMATDKMKGHIKITIVVLLTLGGAFFSFLSLISLQIIVLPSLSSLKAAVYILLLLGNSMVVSTSPLCFEFAVEKLYPVPEGIVGGWLNIWYNIISVFFLLVFNIPKIGTSWLNYVLPLSCFIVLPLLAFIKEEYKRSGLDSVETTSIGEDDESVADELDFRDEEEMSTNSSSSQENVNANIIV